MVPCKKDCVSGERIDESGRIARLLSNKPSCVRCFSVDRLAYLTRNVVTVLLERYGDALPMALLETSLSISACDRCARNLIRASTTNGTPNQGSRRARQAPLIEKIHWKSMR